MIPLTITDMARTDLDTIWEYIAEDNPEHADRILRSIYEEILRVGHSPGLGHRRTDLLRDASVLFWPSGRYLILYRSSSQETVILAVLHGSRDIPAILRDGEAGDEAGE